MVLTPEQHQQLTHLKAQRDHKRSSLNMAYSKLAQYNNYTGIQLNTQKHVILKLQREIETLDSAIQQYMNSTELGADIGTAETYELKMFECLSTIESLTKGSIALNSQPLNQNNSYMKPPPVEVPKFRSEPNECFTKFLSEFEGTVDKFQFPPSDKFSLLKQNVTGRAAFLLESLSVSDQTYPKALKLLRDSFASKDVQVENTIRQLCELRMKDNTDPFAYYSSVQNLLHTADRLQISTDDIYRYFIWHGLNDDFKSAFTQSTNKRRPDLKDIKDNFLAAEQWYQDMKLKEKKTSKHSAQGAKPKQHVDKCAVMAAGVNYTKKVTENNACSLCTKDTGQMADHFLKNCKKYPTPESKCSRAKALGGCTLHSLWKSDSHC